MRRFIIVSAVALFLLPGFVYSQKNRVEKPPAAPMPVKTLLLRWNFTGILDPISPNLSFGVEHKFRSNLSWGMDAGYIYQSGYYPEVKRTNGVILRPSFRYYPGESQRAFLETELHFKTASFVVEDWLGRNCVNGVPSYEEFTRFRFSRTTVGLHMKGGVMGRITKDNRVWVEFYGGLGFRYRTEGLKGEPNSCYTGSVADEGLGPFFISENSQVTLPSVPFGIRLLVKMR